MSDTHYIKKQNVELIFPSEEAVEEQWESLMDFHKGEAHQVMSDVFDRLVPGHQWVRIDSLEINLGKVSMKSFRQDYLGQLRSSLEKAIATAIENKQQTIQTDPVTVWETMIIHYLRYGAILWETAMLSPSLMVNNKLPVRNILEEKMIERVMASSHFVQLLAYTIRENEQAMQRWIRQFSASFHEKIKKILIGHIANSSRSFIEMSCELIEAVITDKQVSYGVWYEKSQSIKWKMLFPGSSISATTYMSEWISGQIKNDLFKKPVLLVLEKSAITHKEELFKGLSQYPGLLNKQFGEQIVIPALLDNIIITSLAGISRGREKMIDSSNDTGVNKQQKEQDHRRDNKDGTEIKEAVEERQKENEELINEEQKNKPVDTEVSPDLSDKEIYIDNAGIVLLAPFIEPFFVQSGIMTGNNMEDDKEASLAIQLLQLLCTDIWDEEEHKLVLNKILCGRAPAWPGYRISEIPANAKQECKELLESIIQHWSVLKNTSPAALQETFLQREGKLVFKDEQWQLFIEYKTTDILLESIPWSFSVIKLPWMKNPLYVNW